MSKYAAFIVCLLSVVAGYSSYGELHQLEVEYPENRFFEFPPRETEKAIFLFNTENELLFATSTVDSTSFQADKGVHFIWRSYSVDFFDEMELIHKKPVSAGRGYLNSPIYREVINQHQMSLLSVLILLLIGVLRVYYRDAFYTFILPFGLYSKTLEKVNQTSSSSLIVSFGVLVVIILGILSLVESEYTYELLSIHLLCLIVVAIAKWLLLSLVSGIFGDASFGRTHLLDFLRFSTFPLLLLYFVLFLLETNHVETSLIYEIVLLPYLFVWFVRLYFVYMKVYHRNLIYFFLIFAPRKYYQCFY